MEQSVNVKRQELFENFSASLVVTGRTAAPIEDSSIASWPAKFVGKRGRARDHHSVAQ
jgi:hypothetical protein